jgi:hypothetical protein
MGGIKTIEANRLSVSKYYASNKDDINRNKILLRIKEGHMPQKISMERYEITPDEVNAERIKGGLEPIEIKNKFKKPEITLEKIKEFTDTITSPSTRKIRFLSLKKVFEEYCTGDILQCLQKPKKMFEGIIDNETNASSILIHVASLLYLVDNYPGLSEKVDRNFFFKMFEGAKLESDNHLIQLKIDDVVPKFSSIVETVEKKYSSASDEVIMVKLYDQVTRRGDFIDIKIGKGTDNENYLVGDILHMNDLKKIKKEPFTEQLKPELMKLITQSLKDRPRTVLFTQAQRTVSNIGGVRLLRKAKASEELEGDAYSNPEKRKALAQNMGHSLGTQAGYIRKLHN